MREKIFQKGMVNMEFFEIELNQELAAAPNAFIQGKNQPKCLKIKQSQSLCNDVNIKNTDSCDASTY